jgi:hypothetical protein
VRHARRRHCDRALAYACSGESPPRARQASEWLVADGSLGAQPVYKDLSRHILITNLPSGSNEMDLTNTLAVAGSIESVRKLGKGRAVVTFQRLEAAKQAMTRFQNTIFRGQKINLAFSTECGKPAANAVEGTDCTDYSVRGARMCAG